MNTQTQRRCSCCRSVEHDIRSCPQYVDNIDQNLIADFTQHGNNAPFPLTLSRPIVYKLGDKYGLSRTLNYNAYLERLILIYSHLGEQRRLERRARRNAENEQRLREEGQNHLPTLVLQDPNRISVAQVVIPFPIAPQEGRFRNILSLQDLEGLRTSFNQLRLEIEEEIVFRIDNSIPKRVLDPSKFTEETLVCDCPICYETKLSVITNCSHSYCVPCMDKMIEIRNNHVSCAMCREKIHTIYTSSEPMEI